MYILMHTAKLYMNLRVHVHEKYESETGLELTGQSDTQFLYGLHLLLVHTLDNEVYKL